MDRYIAAADILGILQKHFDETDLSTLSDAAKEINSLPAADVVEVVRCKDCKYRTWFVPYYGCGNYESPFYAGVDEDVPILIKPDDFCSYGERKAVE